GGEVVEVLQQPAAGQAAHQAEAEGRAPDAAAGERQRPGAGRLVVDAGALAARAHVAVELAFGVLAGVGAEHAGVVARLHGGGFLQSLTAWRLRAGRASRTAALNGTAMASKPDSLGWISSFQKPGAAVSTPVKSTTRKKP